MKVKEEKCQCRNTRKTKIMAIEEIHNFNIDNKGIEIVKDFAYFGLNH